MSLCNLKSNWQSIKRTVLLNYHLALGFIIVTLIFFFSYLTLVVDFSWFQVSVSHYLFTEHIHPTVMLIYLQTVGSWNPQLKSQRMSEPIWKHGVEMTTGASGDVTGSQSLLLWHCLPWTWMLFTDTEENKVEQARPPCCCWSVS